MKPKELKKTSLIMSVFNVAGYIFVNPKSPHLAFELALFTAIILLSYVVLWYYWCGKNWARILVIVTSVLSLINLLSISKFNLIGAAIIASEALLGVYLLYWLNTHHVKAYFKGTNIMPNQEGIPDQEPVR